MPTLKYKVPLEGQPDQIVGCEMFSREDLAKIPNQRGGLFFRVVEKGVYVDYAVPLVDTTDIRASRIRVKKASGTYALSKGDYLDGSWTVVGSESKNGGSWSGWCSKAPSQVKRSPADATGINVRAHLTGHAYTLYVNLEGEGDIEICHVHSKFFWQSDHEADGSLYIPNPQNKRMGFYLQSNSIFGSATATVEVLE